MGEIPRGFGVDFPSLLNLAVGSQNGPAVHLHRQRWRNIQTLQFANAPMLKFIYESSVYAFVALMTALILLAPGAALYRKVLVSGGHANAQAAAQADHGKAIASQHKSSSI